MQPKANAWPAFNASRTGDVRSNLLPWRLSVCIYGGYTYGVVMAQVQISKWGNSSAIRLPKTVLKELGLKPGQTVELTVKDGRGIIEPVRPVKITLDWIISEMKRLGPENEPEMVDWGRDTAGERIDDEYSRGEIRLDDLPKGR